MNRYLCAVSFGSADVNGLRGVEGALAKAFPDRVLLRGFTSRRLAERSGGEAEAAADMLERLRGEGAEDVIVSALFIADGREYRSLCGMAAPWTVTEPLLCGDEDLAAMARNLSETARENNAVVLAAAHGVSGSGNEIFARLQAQCGKDVIIACLEGERSLDQLMPEIGRHRGCPLLLIPLMLTAGAHVLRDLSGEQPQSWRSVLTARGYDVRVQDHGLALSGDVQNRFVQKTRAVCGKVQQSLVDK